MSSLSGKPLSFWEKADRFAGNISIIGAVLYSVVSGVFRGNSGTQTYNLHVAHAAVRKAVRRLSSRQLQSQYPSTIDGYDAYMKEHNITPETVILNHGATGLWIGDKDAENVVVYYHGGGFALPAVAGHFAFLSTLVDDLNKNGHSVAIFFLAYTLTPPAEYPTQLRQAVEALRYTLTQGARDPSNVVVGGDSAGGNLAFAVLLHLTHPHPEIDPITLPDGADLAGVFGFAPWVSFARDGKSIRANQYKDVIPEEGLKVWSEAYLGKRREGDAWSEPAKAPLEWWAGGKAKRVLILAGGDEILFSAVEKFAKKLRTVLPQTTYVVGYGETHVSTVYSGTGMDQQARGLRHWLGAHL
ncbi:Alpha/Beta hydrolase protein [Aspergillus pseudoustus]|uniref:Alpha/Beta hydrolase protein n=1 Tax=Aspergillus pseudoustus TaxID=1810923 RepID=A0ABR4KU96_9EURO